MTLMMAMAVGMTAFAQNQALSTANAVSEASKTAPEQVEAVALVAEKPLPGTVATKEAQFADAKPEFKMELLDGTSSEGAVSAKVPVRNAKKAPKAKAGGIASTMTVAEIDYTAAGARTPRAIVSTEAFGTDSAYIYNMWGLADTLKLGYNTTEGTVSIVPGQVYNHATYGPLWICSYDPEKNTYSQTTPVSGVINADGSLTLSGWGVFVVTGTYKGGAYARYSKTDMPFANAVMTDTIYDSTNPSSKATVSTYPVYVESVNADQVTVLDFAQTGANVKVTLNSDKTATIDPQKLLTNALYGDFYCYATDWTSLKRANGAIEASGSANRLELGQWGIFCKTSSTTCARGYWGTSIAYDGTFNYPAPKKLDWSGSGSESDPYVITTLAQWQAFAESVNTGTPYTGKYVALGADIDMVALDEAYRPVGKNTTHYFDGTFDGKNHTISLFELSASDVDYQGLFGVAGANSTLKNLNITAASVTSYGDYTGTLVGLAMGNVSDIKVTATTIAQQGNFLGGVIGAFQGKTATNLYFSGTVSGYGETGGVVGEMMCGTLSHAQAHGTVQITAMENTIYMGLGGVVGGCIHKADMAITDCFNAALVQDASGYAYTGGVVGDLFVADLKRCYNIGAITSKATMGYDIYGTLNYYGSGGGVAGRVYGANVEDCFNANILVNSGTSTHVGGIMGYVGSPTKSYSGGQIVEYKYQSTIKNCYNSGEVIASTMQATQGIYGTVYADSIMTNCYFDQQMTGNVMPNTASPCIKKTSELTSGAALEGFSADVWNFQEGLYPELKVFEADELSKLAISPATFKAGETTRKVRTDFPVSTANNIDWKIYDSDKGFVTSSTGLTMDGDTMRINHVNSSEVIVARVSGNNNYVKMIMIETVDPTAFQGSGTAEDPYLIRDKDDLLKLNKGITEDLQSFEGDYFIQTNDIDLEGATDFTGIAPTNNVKHVFSGTYDGQGYSIHRLVMNGVTVGDDGKAVQNSSRYYAGFFGSVGEHGTVKNLNIASDCSFYGYSYVGAIVGYNAGRIENCKNYAPVAVCRQYAGGIVGYSLATSVITGCYNGGDVKSGATYAGGIVALTLGEVSECQNDGDITCAYNPDYNTVTQTSAGGIAGYLNQQGSILDCVNTGAVSAPNTVGGLCSSTITGATMLRNINYGTINFEKVDDYSHGAITSREMGPGITIGYNYYDEQLGYYGAANGAPYTGLEPTLTRQLTSGVALDSLKADLYDWQAGQYPVLKAFKDEPRAIANRMMVLTLPDSETIDDVKTIGALADTCTWTLTTAQNFAVSNNQLSVDLAGDAALRDTITATFGGYKKVITLRAMPKMFEGEGTAANPFQITCKDDMLKLARLTNEEGYPFRGAYFKVMNDIDFDTTAYEPVAVLVHKFEADFDGNGKKFLNINYNSTSTLSTETLRGIFGNVGAEGRIHDLTLQSGCIRSYGRGGSIAGRVYGVVENCENHAMVATTKDLGMGGIAGRVQAGGVVRNCKNYGTFETTSYGYIGGIVYDVTYGGLVEDCENMVDIIGQKAYAGGIAAQSAGTVRNCKNHGKISASQAAGGIIGYIEGRDSTYNCYNEGMIYSAGSYVGGIIGSTMNATGYAGSSYLANLVNDGEISGKTEVGGIIGNCMINGTVRDCENHGKITSSTTGTSNNAGGVIGKVSGSGAVEVAYCRNTADVTGNAGYVAGVCPYFYGYNNHLTNCVNSGNVTGSGLYCGGITSTLYSAIDSCYNYGNVVGDTYPAGITGYVMRGSISHCANFGNVTMTSTAKPAANASGIASLVTSGTIDYCYNMGTVTSTALAAGVVCDPRSNSTYGPFTMKNCYNAGVTKGATAAQSNHVMKDITNDYDLVIQNVYYDTDANPDATVSNYDAQCTALTTRQMLNTDMGADFQRGEGMYPYIAYTTEKEIAEFFAATLLLDEADTYDNVQHTFTVGVADGTPQWTATPEKVTFSGTKATPVGLGEVTVTKRYGDLSKDYVLNITKTSGVDEINVNAQVLRREYFGVNGVNYGTQRPTDAGIYLERTTYTNGTTTTRKLRN